MLQLSFTQTNPHLFKGPFPLNEMRGLMRNTPVILSKRWKASHNNKASLLRSEVSSSIPRDHSCARRCWRVSIFSADKL